MAHLLVSAAAACLPVREVVHLVRLLLPPDVSVQCHHQRAAQEVP